MQMLSPCHMKGEVLVAEQEPVVSAEQLYSLDEIPAFRGASPSALGIAEVSERIENGVDIRADPQAQMFEVVADVDDDRRGPGRGNPLQSQRKFRTSYAAAQRDDPSRMMTLSCYRAGHRNRS